jgi:hypothetical protein
MQEAGVGRGQEERGAPSAPSLRRNGRGAEMLMLVMMPASIASAAKR